MVFMSPRVSPQSPGLSSPQREVWFGQLIDADAPLYVIGGYVCLEGPIDPGLFERAIGLTVQRHDALRMVLREGHPLPRADYLPRIEVPLERVDVSGEEDPDRAALAWMTQAFRTPFPLHDQPLFRYALVKLAADRWRWLLKHQHVIVDGWSIALIVQDVARAYRSLAGGGMPDWEPAPSYLDFVRDDQEYLESDACRRHGEYWQEKFRDLPAVLIPRRRAPAGHGRTAPSGVSRLVFTRDDYARIGRFADACGASLVHVLLAALYACFTRTSGQDELVVGMLSLNRRTAACKRTVGMFTKMIPARFQFGTDLSVRELVKAIADELRRDYRHQRYPIGEINRRAGLAQIGRHQLFDLTFSYEKHSHDTAFEDRPARTIGLSNGYEQNALALFVRELHADGDVHLDLHYSLAAFEAWEIERFKARFLFVLEQMFEDAGRRVRDLDLLPPAERDLVLRGVNGSRRHVPRDDTIVGVLERRVEQSAGRVALKAGRVALDYEELNRRANRLARHLRARGIGHECLVGLCLERSEDLVIAMLAVLKAGGAFVPLDPAYPAARRAMTVADARPALVITARGLWSDETGRVPTLALDLDAPEIAAQDGRNLGLSIPSEALAYVNYTSGSTGRPKGVMVSHGNVVNLFAAMDDCLGTHPATWLALTSVAFDISVLELLWTLSRGSTVVLGGDPLDLVSREPARSRSARSPDLSLFYFASDESGEPADKYRLLLDGARFADEKGFAAVWTPERHFHAFGGLYPNPSVTGAAVAAVTRRVQVRAGSVVLPLHHPIRVAEEWAVVDNLSGGRVGLSFASGWQERDFVLAPDRYRERKQTMARDIDLVRRLWRGETVSLPGPDGRAVDVRTLPRPVQPELPVWVTAAGDPATFRLAGELGAGVLTHLLGQSVEELARKIEIYRDAYRRRSGGREGHVTLMLHAFAGRSRAAVLETVREPFRRYLKSSVGLMANVARSLGVDMESERFRDEDMEALLDHAFERYFDTSALFGTPETCRETLDRLAAIGVDEAALLIDFGVSHDAAMDSLEQLAALVADRGTGGDSFADLVRRHGVTHLQCTPSTARLLAAQPAAEAALSSLECLVLGGEELTVSLAQSLQETLPARLYNMYGPTETTVWSTCQPIERGPAVVPIGRPVANTQIYLLDARLNPAPVGVAGELYIGGRGVSRGYLGQPARTAERFVPDPFGGDPGGRLYRTGDLALLRPDGSFEFVGRVDDQLKIRGHRVEPGEVEAVLREHPAIAHAVVVAGPERDGQRRLVAYLVPRAGQRPGPAELRRFAEGRLPAAFVPSDCVIQETLPLTPNGKVDRRALERATIELPAATPPHASPATGPEEEMLAELWSELLGRRPAGPRDNFFESGGHSLLAMLLAQRVRALFGVDVSLRRLFDEPSLGGLAAYIRLVRTPGRAAASRIPADQRTGERALSFAQQRLWFLEQLTPGRSTYIVPACLLLSGPLDVEALRKSLGDVVRRHEVLRSRYPSAAGEPALVVDLADREQTLDLPVIDVSADPDPESAMRRLAELEARRPFDLAHGPVVRARLYRLAPDLHGLLLAMHHIVSDGYWSLALMLRETSGFYESFVAGRTVAPAVLPLQYSDYAAWQRGRLRDGALDASVAYWTERLRGCPQALELPADRPRPLLQSGRGAEVTLEVPDALGAAAKELARACGGTLFMSLSACLCALLARCTHQTDVVLGTAIADRTAPELQDLVGLFVNTLPLRVDLSGDPSFAELVARVRRTCLEAYDHSEVPFEVIVEAAVPERDLGRAPLFQVMLVLQSVPAGPLEMSTLRVTPVHLSTASAKFDLTWTFEERDGRLRGLIEFNTDIFDRGTVERLGESFLVILAAAVDNSATRLSALPVLSESERRRLLDSHETSQAGPDDPCVHEYFERCVRLTPGRPALLAGDQPWTYGELNHRANQLARLLRAHGVGAEVGVGLFLEPSPLQVVGLLAVLKAGGFYLPLDPAYPPRRLAFMIADARPSLVLMQETLRGRLPDTSVPSLVLDLEDPDLLRQSGEDLDLAIAPEQLAYTIYTSGSTGQPRGVAISHRALANHMVWMREAFPLEPDDRVLQRTPFSFDASGWEFLAPLMQGAQLVVADARSRLDPGPLAGTIRAQGVTILQMVPSLLSSLVDEPAFAGASSLRRIFAGGEALDAALVQRVKALLPVEVVNLYGPTEACIDVTFWIDDARQRGTVPIGRPIRRTQAYVLDERLELVPRGVEGELYVGGAGLARGYLSLPEATAGRFVPDPFGERPGARLYRTGDRARVRTDGNLEFLGRRDRQVKIRGCRIEVGEVEAALRLHAGLDDVRVQVRSVHGEPELVAYVAGRPTVDPASIRAALAGALPSFMIPGHVMPVPAWPTLANGKLDWDALPEPDAREEARRGGYVAPRNALEESLADIFAAVLGVERVGIHDGFFELGGHSLKATRAVALAQARGIALSLTDLFQHASPAALANAVIDRQFSEPAPAGAGGGAAPLLPAARSAAPGGHHAVSYGQRRLWVLEHFGEASPYHMSGALEIRGDLDVAALEEAFRAVIARHESLRTRIIEVNGEPRQAIAPDADFTLGRTDLSREIDWQARLETDAAAFFQQPFDLARDLLLRVAVVTIGPARSILLFCQHHIISDGWSIGVMVREILACYAARRAGRSWSLPPLPLQYKEYAAWQRGQLESGGWAAHRRYWLETFADPVEPLRLPLDFPPPRVRPQEGRHLRFRIDTDVADGIRALARSHDSSLFMALTSAVQLLLYRYTSQREMVLGMPVAGRDAPGLEAQIGFYVNLLPVRLALQPAMSFADLLDAVTRRVTSALEHQAWPFDHLVDELQLPRDTSRSPLFDVVVVMQNHEAPALDLDGATVREWPVETGLAKFGLTFEFAETAQGLDGVLEYNTSWFEPATAARMVGHLQALLASAGRTPHRAVSELPIDGPGADAGSRRLRGAAAGARPARETLIQRFEAHAMRRPHAVAVVGQGRRLTYAELDARADRLAARLARESGVGPETLVALLAPRSEAAIVGLLGILKAGGAYLPLDPHDPAERTARLIERSGAGVLLYGGGPPPVPEAGRVRLVRLDGNEPPPAARRAPRPAARVDPQNLAYVIYTSGSTGEPKGVAVTHANLARLFSATEAVFHFGADDVWALCHSLAFDFSVWEIWGALAHGGCLVVVDHETSRSPDRLVDLLVRERVTVLNQTPTAFRGLSDALARRPDLTPGLRWIVFGGEALRPRMLDTWWTLDAARTARVVNMYGITETTVHTTQREMRPEEAAAAGSSPIGVPLGDLQVYVLDEAMNRVPAGIPGELYVAGAGVARGYLADPARTAARFLPDPLGAEPGGRMYRTGDTGRRREDGTLEYLGRNDRQCKIRGFRIELGEIEAQLRAHPAVSDALVVVREAPDGATLAGYLVSRDEGLSVESIRAHLERRLPGHMVPAHFVRLDRWPLTPNGKIDVKALPAAGERGLRASVDFVAPETPVERTLAGLWTEALNVERVGAHDDFFALGGHSVSAIRVIQGIREALGRTVSLTVLFEYPVLRDLAGHLDGLAPEPSIPGGGPRAMARGRIGRRTDRPGA